MQNVWRFSFMFIAFLLSLFSQSPMAESTEQKRIRIERVSGNDDADRDALQMKDPEGRGQLLPLGRLSVAAAEEGFTDNGDGTVTDTKRNLMWRRAIMGRRSCSRRRRSTAGPFAWVAILIGVCPKLRSERPPWSSNCLCANIHAMSMPFMISIGLPTPQS